MTELRYPMEPVMDLSDSVYYRNYRLTSHSIERYIERVGGDLGNMIADLDSSWLFDARNKRAARKVSASVHKSEQSGGWALTNGNVVFIVMPENKRHVIVTTLLMEGFK
ncbi:hypothetical protein ACK85N_001158 [Salmonella enterica]|nr:hypothetical protein [Salmonella enterica]EBU7310635.1 hypothetical protein [Salmonella enterica subsp. enterica serovar Panama]ECC1244374.1 hypothetical protein [Salmonella enterica subsp. enterica serovar Poona]EHN6577537.1 hypothetical protein [Salmonella enterica subsp. enterica serovar Anecho]EKO0905052.1 hypothetical protein [Salmonella enterica subsp. enterica]EKR1710418.1 hypothetical protein [Salmonella enterica subsp. enterica serovar Carrau]MLT78558.1 hypothetical protein [Salmo